MPISDKQLAANRANAKKSTGPRTPKGKAVCRLNGFQHGFTGLAVVMTEEDRQAQNAFVRPYVQALNPIGPIELQLAQTIALDNFRLNRLKAVEENMFAYGELGPLSHKIDTEHARVHHAIVQAQVFVLNDRSFNNLSLYEQRITRNIHKNLKLLREEQALRKREALLDAKTKTQPLTLTGPLYGDLSLTGPLYGDLSLTGPLYGDLSLTGPLYGDLSRTASTASEENGSAFSTALSEANEAPIAPPKAA